MVLSHITLPGDERLETQKTLSETTTGMATKDAHATVNENQHIVLGGTWCWFPVAAVSMCSPCATRALCDGGLGLIGVISRNGLCRGVCMAPSKWYLVW